MTAEDLPGAMDLSKSANWNQTEEDWQRLLRISSCFCIEDEGRAVASVSVTVYGSKELAWIGMVLTLPEYRGRGLASALMGAALDECADVRCVKLDATDAGAPVYRKLGFEDECMVERWRRPALPPLAPELATGGTPDLAMDRTAFGADRRLLLASFPEVCTAHDGYAMRRPGLVASQFGPCVAESQESARLLAEWGCSPDGGGAVYWDLFESHAKAREVAHGLRFTPARWLLRMSYQGRTIEQDPAAVYAQAGFEFG